MTETAGLIDTQVN